MRLGWARRITRRPDLALTPASTDASFRSYWRIHHAGRSWIVMDSPPALEDPRPWLAIGARLAAAGLHVPTVAATDLELGFLLIEDLGSRLYLPELNDASVDALYGDAMDALLRMQSDADATGLPPYDEAFLARELEIMPEWFLARHLGHTPDRTERATLDAAFAVLVANALEQPQCFVHRDFHSRNLLVTAQGNPGVIDFQGALLGPIAYDLASLLRDCYIGWAPARVDAWVESYRQRLHATGLIAAEVDAARFQRWFDLIGLQRHLKILGIFCRLWYRDGKRGYLDDLPLTYEYVISVSRRYPELHALAALIERCAAGRDITAAVSA
jgi:aminoglycoside/choline kinase family phosphotransferase